MNVREAMRQLEAAGSAQTRKIYRNHGVTGDMFGVSYANLGKLHKKIKIDHELAEQLWATGNHDARVLALKVADPLRMSAKDIDAWVKQLDNRVLVGEFAGLVRRTRFAKKRMEKWTKSKSEWVGSVGWCLLAGLALKDDSVSDDELTAFLERIEEHIHSSKNRVRHNMNQALIAIGVRNATLNKRALAVAKRIGKVEVDHGQHQLQDPRRGGVHRKDAGPSSQAIRPQAIRPQEGSHCALSSRLSWGSATHVLFQRFGRNNRRWQQVFFAARC